MTDDIPFVIIPGIGISHRYSDRLTDALARSSSSSTTVLSLALPGFAGYRGPDGSAARPDRMTVPDLAGVVIRMLDDRSVTRAMLIGRSMGAAHET